MSVIHKQVFRFKFYADTIEQLGVRCGVSFLIHKKSNSNRLIRPPGISHPVLLRPGTSDEKVFMKIFIGKDYDINLGFEPEYIIDGGANVGLASIYFANKYKAAKIIGIEPDDENFTAFKSNTANYKNILTKKTGLWNERATKNLSDKYGLGKWGMTVVDEAEKQENGNPIELVTITDIMNEFDLPRIDLLKLDVESAEKQIFSSNYMDWLPKVRVITIELHDWMLDGCSKAFFTAINNAFDDYAFFSMGENTVIVNNSF